METLIQVSAFFTESVFPHWPGLFFIVFITILAQTLKSQLLTVEFARKSKIVFWCRRVYPILLLLLGVLPGVLWQGAVYPSIDQTSEKIMYFVGCSGISILGFNIFKQWVKKKYDINVEVVQNEKCSEENKG